MSTKKERSGCAWILIIAAGVALAPVLLFVLFTLASGCTEELTRRESEEKERIRRANEQWHRENTAPEAPAAEPEETASEQRARESREFQEKWWREHQERKTAP